MREFRLLCAKINKEVENIDNVGTENHEPTRNIMKNAAYFALIRVISWLSPSFSAF